MADGWDRDLSTESHWQELLEWCALVCIFLAAVFGFLLWTGCARPPKPTLSYSDRSALQKLCSSNAIDLGDAQWQRIKSQAEKACAVLEANPQH